MSSLPESEKMYEKFHSTKPDKIQIIRFKIPKKLTKLGKVVSISYKPDPPSAYSESTWIHSFKKKPILATDGKNLFIIGKIKISSRGIEG